MQGDWLDYQSTVERDVWVFKTNMNDRMDVHQLQIHLALLPGVLAWSADLDDCDRVLRVESHGLGMHDIVKCVHEAGFECGELV